MKKTPYWLIGGLIGLGLGVMLYFMGGFLFPLIPLYFIVNLSGLDFFIHLFNLVFTSLYPQLGVILFGLLGSLIGYLSDKKVQKKRKLILLTVLLIIFIPLSSYTHYVKFTDKKVMVENKIGASMRYPKSGHWNSYNQKTCEKLSIFVHNLELIGCFNSVAKNNKDISLCEVFEQKDFFDGTNRKWGCYIGVATATRNTEICKLIEKANRKEACFTIIARIEKDSSICDNAGSSKQECYSAVEREINDTY